MNLSALTRPARMVGRKVAVQRPTVALYLALCAEHHRLVRLGHEELAQLTRKRAQRVHRALSVAERLEANRAYQAQLRAPETREMERGTDWPDELVSVRPHPHFHGWFLMRVRCACGHVAEYETATIAHAVANTWIYAARPCGFLAGCRKSGRVR